jgi:hypothetical protein
MPPPIVSVVQDRSDKRKDPSREYLLIPLQEAYFPSPECAAFQAVHKIRCTETNFLVCKGRRIQTSDTANHSHSSRGIQCVGASAHAWGAATCRHWHCPMDRLNSALPHGPIEQCIAPWTD